MKYCKYCGKEIEDNATCDCKKLLQKPKNIPKIIGISAISLIVIILAAVFIKGNTKPDIAQFAEVRFEGIDGKGTATVYIDDYTACEAVLGKEPNELDALIEWSNVQEDIEDGVEYTISKSQGLSNGDKITVEFNVNDEAEEYVRSITKTYTVSGLTVLKEIDVFELIDIHYSGFSGQGEIDFYAKTDNAFLEELNFSLSDTSLDGELSNGDEIEVIVECSDHIAQKYGKIPKENNKTVIVSGLSELMTAQDITQNIINEIKAYFESDPIDILNDSEYYSYSDITYHSAYFFTVKDEYKDSFPTPNPNKLVIYYSAKQYHADGDFSDNVYISLKYTGDYKFNDYNYEALAKFESGNNIIVENANVGVSDYSFEEVLSSDCGFYTAGKYNAEKLEY